MRTGSLDGHLTPAAADRGPRYSFRLRCGRCSGPRRLSSALGVRTRYKDTATKIFLSPARRAAGQVLRVAPAVAQQPGEWGEQAEETLHQPRRPGEPNYVVEFAGEDGQLQEVRHPPLIDLAVLGQPERVGALTREEALTNCYFHLAGGRSNMPGQPFAIRQVRKGAEEFHGNERPISCPRYFFGQRCTVRDDTPEDGPEVDARHLDAQHPIPATAPPVPGLHPAAVQVEPFQVQQPRRRLPVPAALSAVKRGLFSVNFSIPLILLRLLAAWFQPYPLPTARVVSGWRAGLREPRAPRV